MAIPYALIPNFEKGHNSKSLAVRIHYNQTLTNAIIETQFRETKSNVLKTFGKDSGRWNN